jgi:hypothetical protein
LTMLLEQMFAVSDLTHSDRCFCKSSDLTHQLQHKDGLPEELVCSHALVPCTLRRLRTACGIQFLLLGAPDDSLVLWHAQRRSFP